MFLNYIDYSDHFGVDGFNAFISYREQDYSNLTNRKVFTSNLGFDVNELVIPNQVHSKRVKMVESACLLKETDGVISNAKNVVLSIQVADCIPLFLFNPISHQFGMIHSGSITSPTRIPLRDTVLNRKNRERAVHGDP